jgi:hypothetical protein
MFLRNGTSEYSLKHEVDRRAVGHARLAIPCAIGRRHRGCVAVTLAAPAAAAA